MAQKFSNGIRTAYAEAGEKNKQFTKLKIYILHGNTNKKLINSNLTWLKYFLTITWIVAYVVNIAVLAIQIYLSSGLGLEGGIFPWS